MATRLLVRGLAVLAAGAVLAGSSAAQPADLTSSGCSEDGLGNSILHFTLTNGTLGGAGVCGFSIHLVGSILPSAPCPIDSVIVPPGWTSFVNGIGTIGIAGPADCLGPGEQRSGFAVRIPLRLQQLSTCCYMVAFRDEHFEILYADEFCFFCGAPVGVAPETWGGIKGSYR